MHFEFGQDRLTQPHPLKAFELPQGAVKVPLEVKLRRRTRKKCGQLLYAPELRLLPYSFFPVQPSLSALAIFRHLPD